MNTSKYIENSKRLLALDSRLGLQTSLTNLLNVLGNLASNPAHTPFQQDFGVKLGEFETAFNELENELNPALTTFFVKLILKISSAFRLQKKYDPGRPLHQ